MIETFHVSIIATNATKVVYWILFGSMHLAQYIVFFLLLLFCLFVCCCFCVFLCVFVCCFVVVVFFLCLFFFSPVMVLTARFILYRYPSELFITVNFTENSEP